MFANKFRLSLLCLTTAAMLAVTAWAFPARAADLLDHARDLAREGDWYRAQGEIKSFLYFNPEDSRKGEALQLKEEVEAALDRVGSSEKPSASPGFPARIAIAMVRFYQDHLRTFTAPGSSCPSYPSCSEYAIEALEKHGYWIGVSLTVDRFWREFTTAGGPPEILAEGAIKHYDPLAANDYWLADGPASD